MGTAISRGCSTTSTPRRDHVHLLIYGYKPGDIGTAFRDALAAKVAEGVEVRLQVDAIGSEVDFGSKDLFRDLRDVRHRRSSPTMGLRRPRGQLGSAAAAARFEDALHFDHRKMAVIDGAIGYVGGSGIEDHYNDERFYDVMCRVTGPVVAQLQLVFLASWRNEAGGLPTAPELDRWFPRRPWWSPTDAAPRHRHDDPVERAGHRPPSHQRRDRGCDGRGDASASTSSTRTSATGRSLRRLLRPRQRGVPVRLIAPGKPTPPYPAAAFRHHYGRLIDAGVEILLHPEMAHAKVLRIDDKVFIGGCNLDDLSLFRNDELDLLFEDPSMPALAEATRVRRARGDVRPRRPFRPPGGRSCGTPRWIASPACSSP